MRYALSLSYRGAAFCGWQIQKGVPTVQETLEQALSTLLRMSVGVTGAGRTDTGVHAADYLAHFDAPEGAVPDPAELTCKLNAILPRSIVVHAVVPAGPEFHARFDAKRREYTYFLHRRKDPFVEAFSWQCSYPHLDFAAMNAACAHLGGTHDFSCFEKTGGDNKTSVCTVYEAFWAPYTPTHLSVMSYGQTAPPGVSLPERTDDYWYFRISADRFLRNMVRAVTGSLIEVGRGRRNPDWFAGLIASGTRSDAGESVPGHALFLSKILY